MVREFQSACARKKAVDILTPSRNGVTEKSCNVSVTGRPTSRIRK